MNKVEGRVGQAEIEKVLSKIVGRFHPQKVILFGSYAYGQPHEWSDLDLLAVTPDLPPCKERWKITDELERGMSLPLQIIFMNPEEFEETKDVVGGIAYPAHHWGKILYESNA